ncbi:MAG: aminotransferase [Deltaproteobacteria bacterium]|nr:aminotransferase [Deltaproteobacteria bacterium]
MTGHRAHWDLDEEVTFLNHGSYGACPRVVREAQRAWQDRMESEPVRFFQREYQDALDEARASLGALIGAQPEDLAFVPNATYGVNSVVASFPLRAGDEILVPNHAYAACHNAVDYFAERAGAQVKVIPIPFPCEDPEIVIERVLAAVTDRTVLALIDWVTSPTALMMPVAGLVEALEERGVDTLVDAAHGVGMTPLDLDTLGAAYTTGNCHKWLCTPKGSAFLHVRADRRERVRPAAISHGATASDERRSRFHLEFDWTGTYDPTALLVIPDAIAFLETLEDGGIDGLMARNRSLCLTEREHLADLLRTPLPCPESMIGTLAAIPLRNRDVRPAVWPLEEDPLQEWLWAEARVEIPVFAWPALDTRMIRISAAAHNDPSDYARLREALKGAPSELL